MAEPRKRRERGTGRVYLDRAKDRWVAAITVEGRVTKRLFRTKPDAEAGLKRLAALAEAHQLATTNQTVDQYLAEYLEDHVRENLSARTYQTYKGKLSTHVSPRLGKRRLRDLEPAHIRELYRQLREDGTLTRHKQPRARPLSPNSIASVHTILHGALAWAVRDGRIPSNPLDRVHPPQRVEYEAAELDEEAIRPLLAAIKGTRYEHLWRFQLATGVRHGEATGIRESDVDPERMVARIWEAIAAMPLALRAEGDGSYRWWERKGTKTKRSRRSTPLTLPALRAAQAGAAQAAALREAAGASWCPLEPGLLFPDDDGRPLRESKVLKAWNRLLERHKLPACRPHDLRHGYAGLALDGGAELIDVSRALGHASTAITDRIYGGRVAQGARRAAERVAEVFGEDGPEGS